MDLVQGERRQDFLMNKMWVMKEGEEPVYPILVARIGSREGRFYTKPKVRCPILSKQAHDWHL